MSLTTIGKYIIRLETVDSTNNYAAALISKNKPAEGTAIMADFQDYGRGQRETIWESENGKNLLVSFILYPQIDAADYFLLNICFSLAACELIENITGLNAKIKWPNDILVNNKKIAGILIENSIRGNSFLHSIGGIGINVNQEIFSDFALRATSLKKEMKRDYAVSEVLNKLCTSLNKWYAELCNENFKMMRNSYLNSIYQIGKSTKYKSKGEIFKGTIRGVNTDGKLQIETENGDYLNFGFKEVTYLFDGLPLINT